MAFQPFHLCDMCSETYDLDVPETKDEVDFIEDHPDLVKAGHDAPLGYWTCECCGIPAIGRANVYEVVE